MQSRNGNPNVAPAARRNVLRDRYFFAMNMAKNWHELTTGQIAGRRLSTFFRFAFLDPICAPDIEFTPLSSNVTGE
jgi:hypothetical protein